MAAGQVTQPVRAAGGTAAIPLTTVVYAATSLTFQRAALPRRSWQPCATWPPACSPSRAGQCRRALVPQPRPLSDPWRPSDQARIKRTSRKNTRALGSLLMTRRADGRLAWWPVDPTQRVAADPERGQDLAGARPPPTHRSRPGTWRRPAPRRPRRRARRAAGAGGRAEVLGGRCGQGRRAGCGTGRMPARRARPKGRPREWGWWAGRHGGPVWS